MVISHVHNRQFGRAVRAQDQHDIAKEPWTPAALKVRIGIHLGETAEVKHDPSMAGKKVTGLSVDLTARIMGLATGGQILMTRFAFNSEARQFVAEHPPVPSFNAGSAGGSRMGLCAEGDGRTV